jgi:Flp pilus assembly protein TadB
MYNETNPKNQAERRCQVNDIKAKRRYSDPTKADYIIRCMAAENTVRQQDKALAEEKQARAKAELDALWLTEENARLRQRAIGWFTAWAIAVICLAVIAIAGVCK